MLGQRVLVIGGGPAGAACALHLRTRGVAVDLVEKSSFPRRKACGCCLGGTGLKALQTLAVAESVQDQSVELRRWIGFVGGREVDLRLPTGVAVSREVLDVELLASAAAAGVRILQPMRAKLVEQDAAAVRVELAVLGQTLGASGTREERYDYVVVAGGLAAEGLNGFLPWMETPHGPFGVSVAATAGDAVAAGVVYMCCGDDGYAGLVRLANGAVAVAGALRRGATAADCKPLERVKRLLPDRLRDQIQFSAQDRVLVTPPMTRQRVPGVGRVLAIGDTAGYVEPFTGEGMTWALTSGISAAEWIAGSENAGAALGASWAKRYQTMMRSRRRVCSAVSMALRSSWARWSAGRILRVWPHAATPLLRSLNHPVV